MLLTLVTLTLGTWGVMLARWAFDNPVDGNLLAAGTTLLGLLTGSAIKLGASPAVPKHEPAAALEALDAPEELLGADLPAEEPETGYQVGKHAYSPENGPDDVSLTAADLPPAGEF